MPNITKNETIEIVQNWELELTNIQISNKLNIPVKKVTSTLNRLGYKSHRYEKIDESQLIHLLIGSYLGDGHFTKVENDQNSRLCFTHGIAQEEYFNWKCQRLKNLNLFNSIYKTHNILVSKSKPHPIFTKYRKEGYEMSLGKINFKLIESLNAESFSIWYFDDGSVTNDGVSITCQNLNFEEKEIMKSLISKNLDLQVNVTSNSLYVPKNEMEKFRNITSLYCLKSMVYKLIPYHQR